MQPSPPPEAKTARSSRSLHSLRSFDSLRSLRTRWRRSPRPPRWVRALAAEDVAEHVAEQALPVVLLLGLAAAAGALATSTAMLAMHFPVHTVLCRGGPGLRCYPNFFVTTWLMMFAASLLSGSFYLFLCRQQQALRLRQGVAMAGAVATMLLWLSTVSVGFLPTQVTLDGAGTRANSTMAISGNITQIGIPRVRAYGMLTSSLENYWAARGGSANVTAGRGSLDGPAQLIWRINDVSQTSADVNTTMTTTATIYRTQVDGANRF